MRANAVLISAVLVLIPGLGATFALYGPGEAGLALRIALAFALGCCVVGGVAFVLAIGHVLIPASFLLLLVLVTGGLWLLGVRSGSMSAQWRALAAEVRGDRSVYVAGILVLVTFAVLRLTYSPLLNFAGSTPWRYWADAREISLAHGIPAVSLQYGLLLTPTTNKVMLNVLDAGAIFVLGRQPLPALGAMLWIGSTGLAAALWALGRELRLRYTAILLPVLALASGVPISREFGADLTTFKAEIFGRMVAFAALAVAIRAVRGRRAKDAAVAGVMLGAAAAIHLVPVVIALIMLSLYVLALLVVERRFALVTRQAAVILGVFVAVGGALLYLPRGDLGLRGDTGNSPYSSFAPGFDPTLYLNSGRLPGRLVVGPRTWYVSPARAARAYVGAAAGLGRSSDKVRRAIKWLLGVGGLAAAAAMLFLFPKEIRPVGVMCYGLGASIVVLTWLFSLRYHLYIPAWFGIRRLFDYGFLPLIIFGLALVEGAILLLPRLSRSRPARVPIPAMASLVLVVTVAALVLPGSRSPSGGGQPLDRGLISSFEWIRANVPCDARILANLHTEGVFEALTGRVAVLEGMTPYLRPAILGPIVRLLLDAHDFFLKPQDGQAFLAREGVDYIVILRTGRVGYFEPIGKFNTASLNEVPFLKPVYSSPAMMVYRVEGVTRPTGLPDPSRTAGFHCDRGPIRP
jgi:hypothetical protein